ncbi:hypothetical protein [Cohnella sp. OV330]|uniref:hypothetical protein n=1 Tax=Cohnella sp. OV330 TaxID=1855288 RepID=UPI000B7D16F7|nr:hypothetical protein [Cohnella sp. OV330]
MRDFDADMLGFERSASICCWIETNLAFVELSKPTCYLIETNSPSAERCVTICFWITTNPASAERSVPICFRIETNPAFAERSAPICFYPETNPAAAEPRLGIRLAASQAKIAAGDAALEVIGAVFRVMDARDEPMKKRLVTSGGIVL